MGWEFLLLNRAALKRHFSLAPSLCGLPTNNSVCMYFWHKAESPMILDCNYNDEFQKACKWLWALQ